MVILHTGCVSIAWILYHTCIFFLCKIMSRIILTIGDTCRET